MSSNATGSNEMRVSVLADALNQGGSITSLADGGWVVTWQAYETSGVSTYTMRYDSDGTALSLSPRLVSQDPAPISSDSLFSSSAAGLADGGWIVTYTTYDSDSLGSGQVWEARFYADGSQRSYLALINEYLSGDQDAPSVTALADGGWLATWQSFGQDGSSYGVYQQRYDSDDIKVGVETLVNTTTSGAESNPAVTALPDGGWVVVWNAANPSNYDIYLQRFDANGDKAGGETRVNTYVSDTQADPAVTALADGGWLVTWNSEDQDGDSIGIFQQRYDRDGNTVGLEAQVNTETNDQQIFSSVAALNDGGWVVTWDSFGQDGENLGVYQQRYATDGSQIGGETLVNVHTEGGQSYSSVTALADGGWVVSWESDAQDGGLADIYHRHFAVDIVGTDAADSLSGTSWGEYLIGGGSNDTLDGGGGDDIIIGGDGDDIYIVNSETDTVDETGGSGEDLVRSSVDWTLGAGVENLTLTGDDFIDAIGNGGANILIGNLSENTLEGLGGDDTLNGGAGDDVMIGGLGNDTYVVDSLGDLIIETGAGIDLVRSSVSWTLAADLENLTLLGTAVNGTGNAADNVITGNAGDNVLDGMGGDDTLIGGLGDDVYVVNAKGDRIDESGGRDLVRASVSWTLAAGLEDLKLSGTAANGTGNGGDNVITGNAGNNVLDGTGGSDTLAGGAGNDTYIVDSKDDTINDTGGGNDLVKASLSWTLGAGVERLELLDSASDGTGNAADNVIIGNDGNNLLDGMEGDDTLIGGLGDDVYVVNAKGDRVIETGGGTDLVRSSVSWTLGAGLEDLTLQGAAANGRGNTADNIITGTAVANTLSGGVGNDTLIGGGGKDVLIGGAGNDNYYIDSANDRIVETGGGGTQDKIFSRFSISLQADGELAAGTTVMKSPSIEQLELTGSKNLGAYGNSRGNVIIGNSGDNILRGFAGKDALSGGEGNDTLRGGSSWDRLDGGDGFDLVQYGDQDKPGLVVNLAAPSSNKGYAAGDVFISIENLRGSGYGDTLIGNAGANTIYGGGGNDMIDGGGGGDHLFGQADADRFVFKSVSAEMTTIGDFTPSDRIDLVAIDANLNASGNQRFDYIQAKAFTGHAGELRCVRDGQDMIISGDVDGDGKADLQIRLDNTAKVDASDFYL